MVIYLIEVQVIKLIKVKQLIIVCVSTIDRLNELIKHWLEEGDLLRLEHVVIAGQGDRLLNVRTNDKQVEDFLNLVPAYMEKIKNVHTAVAHGNMEEVQKILTRKRFALCRDQYGASPLHLSVLHGHIDILIYIITQFPETIDGPDNVSVSTEYDDDDDLLLTFCFLYKI